MQIRQSLKGVKAAYIFEFLLAVAIGAYWFIATDRPDIPAWLPFVLPTALLLFTLIRHLQRRTTCITISGDRLRYEAGLFAKTTRIMELAKVQDVRVDQGLGQRMINTGNLSVETAGETSRITMASIDRPHEAADHILELSREQRNQPPPAQSRAGA